MRTCLYGLKEICLKDNISHELCNRCSHVHLHRILNEMMDKLKKVEV